MPPKKNTKAYREEYVRVHYGIHMDSLEVRSVWERRDGVLSLGGFTHHVLPGRQAESELIIVFGIGDIRTLPAHMAQSHGAETRKELEAIAEAKRAERVEGKDQS